jgi:Ser-tRNA(Ala) deacylase AlaX
MRRRKKEAAALPLRKEPKWEGTLRLIEIEEVDLSACGTLVSRIGAMRIIAVSAPRPTRGLRERGGGKPELAPRGGLNVNLIPSL